MAEEAEHVHVEDETDRVQQNILDQLHRIASMLEMLETISAQLCPVCGPKLAQEKHPDEVPATNGKTQRHRG